jgi:hypothetical protein
VNKLLVIFLMQLTTVIYSEELDILIEDLITTHPEIQSLQSELKVKGCRRKSRNNLSRS